MALPKKRRAFLKAMAGAPLLPAVLVPAASAQAPVTPVPSPTPSEVAAPLAKALAEGARHRFGAHLGPGDLAEIEKAIDGNLKAAERLRTLKLDPADEPVTVFEARPRRRRGAPDARGPRRGVRPVRLKED
jgi:hypothetical protein